MLEVHKEKRLSAALQEELTHARRTKEDSMREFTQATEEANRLRSGLAKEQEAHVASKLQVEKLEGQMTELKRSLVEYQSRCMLAEERLTEERRLHEVGVFTAQQRSSCCECGIGRRARVWVEVSCNLCLCRIALCVGFVYRTMCAYRWSRPSCRAPRISQRSALTWINDPSST